MNTPIVTNYVQSYVLLSIFVAFVGSYLGLVAAARIRQSNGSFSMVNTVSAGVALGGIGVWAMHFIGMAAMKMDVGVSFAPIETVFSLVAAVVATALAFRYVAQAPDNMQRIAIAGTLLGLGVVFMHYLGIYGLRFYGFIQWNWATVALSVLIAIIAATFALWLAFKTGSIAKRLPAALVMAAAVCAMHYTGMGAAEFICTTESRQAMPTGFGYFHAIGLAGWVGLGALGVALIISVDQYFQKWQGRAELSR